MVAIARSVEAENRLLEKWCRKRDLELERAGCAYLCGRPRDGGTVYAIIVEGHNGFARRHRGGGPCCSLLTHKFTLEILNGFADAV